MYEQQTTIKNRTVFCKDNLEILRGINSNSIDLIYLDPPFNKKRNFHAPIGSGAEGASFKDTWYEEDTKEEWIGLIAEDYPSLHSFLSSVGNIGDKSNKYYLTYMAIRLIEIRRVLKDTGSVYLHCDTTMSHFLKLLMDCIFGDDNFRNEIVWCYTGPSGAKKAYPKKHDAILFYSKTSAYFFYPENIRIPYKSLHSDKGKKAIIWGEEGKLQNEQTRLDYLNRGKIPEDFWVGIGSGGHMPAIERLGYPTQKPITLLERIIKASSKEGDVLLDPFCGCATALVAAEKLNRQWIGIDVSKKAFDLIRIRLDKEIADKQDLFKKDNALIFRTDIPQRTDVIEIKIKPIDKKHILFGKQQGICHGCKMEFQYKNLEVDHIIPRVKGGGDNIENLQLLCGHCNRVKNDNDMPYLLARLKQLKIIT